MTDQQGTWDVSFFESQNRSHIDPYWVPKLGIKVGVGLGTPGFRQIGVVFGRPSAGISAQRFLLRVAWACVRCAWSPYLWGWGPKA